MVRSLSGNVTEQAFSPTSSTCSIFVLRHALYNFFQRVFESSCCSEIFVLVISNPSKIMLFSLALICVDLSLIFFE